MSDKWISELLEACGLEPTPAIRKALRAAYQIGRADRNTIDGITDPVRDRYEQIVSEMRDDILSAIRNLGVERPLIGKKHSEPVWAWGGPLPGTHSLSSPSPIEPVNATALEGKDK